jgi:uncharacterized protein (DUF427 family)
MERVWDYPRPPALVPCGRRVRIEVDGRVVADTDAALRILETSHPPTVYLPPGAFEPGLLRIVRRRSFCEWKGVASYVDIGDRHEAGWTYPDPVPAYAALKDFVSVYPSRMDACWLGDERVQAQEGDFYGGWITTDLVGPFKGAPGTLAW